MRRITGKIMAAVLSTVMTLSPLAGELTVYADELAAIGLEDIAGDTLDGKDDVADPAATDVDLIVGEEAGDIMSEEETEDISFDAATAEEKTDLIEDGKSGLVDDTDDLSADGISYINGTVNPPVTGGRSIRLASSGTGIQKNQHIYFGTMDQDNYSYSDEDKEHRPYWRVLDPARDNTGKKGIFVMSEALWGNKKTTSNPLLDEVGIKFNDDTDAGNKWYDNELNKSCNARDWCGNYLTTNFSEEEQKAIKAVSKEEETKEVAGHKWKKCYLKGDRVFFLSAQEVCDYLDDDYYTARYLDNDYCWWLLRSANYDNNFTVGRAGNYIENYWKVDEPYYVRPAFNLDPSLILLTSAAKGGKSSGDVGPNALKAVENKSIKDWKLTVIDKTRSFAADRTDSGDVAPGGSIKIHYSDALGGDREYVSAALCDNSGNILYYGRLVEDSPEPDGDTKIMIPRNLPAGNTYQLYVFSERVCDDYRTDYASAPSKISLRVPFHIKNTVLSQTDYTYNGSVQIPSVKKGSTTLVKGRDYTVTITKDNRPVSNPVNAGTYKMTLTGMGNYVGTTTKTFKINPVKMSSTTLSKSSYKYNGTVQIPSVKNGKTTLKKGTDYSVTITNEKGKKTGSPRNAGIYKMTVTGKGNYSGTSTKTYEIKKISNTLKVSKKPGTHNFKASKLKSKNKTIKSSKLYKFSDKGQGKLTYTLRSAKNKSTGKSVKRKFAISSKGKLTVKKGLGKGTYTVKIKIKAKGDNNHKAKATTLTYTIKVKK